jgi:hypothetical protein
MNNNVLPVFFSVFFLLLVTSGYSQNLDLIVTSKADSIACHIDSISDTHIFYRMKSHSTWINTQIPLSEVSDYNENTISRKDYVFKPGTTIIDTSIPVISAASMHHVHKNSVYLGILSINYARMVPLSQTLGLTMGGGLINIDGWGVVVESSLLFGSFKHFLETGIMGAYIFAPNQEPDNPESGSEDPVSAVTFRIGYRYQAPGGFLFRVAPNLIISTEDIFIFPGLSIGYSF